MLGKVSSSINRRGDDEPRTLEQALSALAKEREERLRADSALKSLEQRLQGLKSRLDREAKQASSTEGAFHHLMSCLPVAFLVEDSSARIVWAHPAYLEMFQLGIEPERLRGTDMRALESNARHLFIEPDRYIERLEEIRSGTTAALGDVLELSSGSIWIRDCHPTPLGRGGSGWIHVLRDVTAQRARDARLERTETEARESERKAIRFLGSITHELRTPLAAILGLAELARSGEAQLQQVASRIHFNAELLGHLVEDISTFAQLDDGHVKLSQGPVAPSTVLAQVEGQMRELASEKGLSLTTSSDPALPTMVLGDAMRTRQLLVGLVGNAIKFTERGSVTVRAFRALPDRPDEITYEVEDTGIGIPEAERRLVFERYFRGRSDAPGTGLGLSICRDLVHAMGGKIGLESAENRGTCVFFTLVQPALTDASPSDLDYHVPKSRMSLSPHRKEGARVLLVEDDPINRRLLSRMLENAGYGVHSVGRAEEALEAVRERHFDVLVTDISMPGMDGVELVEALRGWERKEMRPATPAVVVTAHVLSEYQERCREAGVDVFLGKPINGTALRRALAKLSPPPAKVLLVDDSWDARILLEVCLEQYPGALEVHAANSGQTAIAACSEHEFSVIFIDALMPTMSGIETIEAIRNIPSHACVPIIAVTALQERQRLDELKAAGFDEVLTKPIDRHKVHKVVRDCLRASVVVHRAPSERAIIESAPTLLQLQAVSQKG